MRKRNAVNDKVKNKSKIIAILVLVLAIVASTIIAVYNFKYKNTKILAKIIDIDGKVSEQEMILKLYKNDDGTYSLKLPDNVNSNYVTTYFTEDGEEIEINRMQTDNEIQSQISIIPEPLTEEEIKLGEEEYKRHQENENNEDINVESIQENKVDTGLSEQDFNIQEDIETTNKNVHNNILILTKEQVEKGKINLQTKYDMEEVNKESEDEGEETKEILYNKKLEYNNGELAIEGYMPLNSELQVKQEKITDEEKIENKTNLKKLSVSVYEKIKGNEDEQTELVEYNPSEYNQELMVKTGENKSIVQQLRTTLENDNYVNLSEVSLNNSNKTILLEEKAIDDVQQVGGLSPINVGDSFTIKAGQNLSYIRYKFEHKHSIVSGTCPNCNGVGNLGVCTVCNR